MSEKKKATKRPKSGKATMDPRRRKAALIAGGVLLLLALALYFTNPDAFYRMLDIATGAGAPTPAPGYASAPEDTPAPTAPAEAPEAAETDAPDGVLEVYLLDVGQGDSIFLRSPKGKTMLVDASESQHFSAIEAFLAEQGVEKLDVVVATHPHSDHIGSMYKVIETYEVDKFYMPAVTHTTNTFDRMLAALEEKGIGPRIAYAAKSAKIAWGDGSVNARILSPFEGVDYELNDWSIVLRVEFGDTSILLTGDAEEHAEEVMLANLSPDDLASTVIKLGHHGSSTSTTEAFLDVVSPEIAVVSVGAGNDYGHPHEETLERLEARGITLYRTDEQGTIKLVLDGADVNATVEKD